ncbi:putative ABC transporter substrate-binding lipoprotein YhfQ precursor [compost metagenome]
MTVKMMKLLMLLIAALLLLVACSNNTNMKANMMPSDSSPAPSASATSSSSEVSAFWPVTVVDSTGKSLTFDKPVKKVACVVSLCIDVLAELGMEPAAIAESGVRVIATAPEFYGTKGKSYPSIGGSFFEPSLEDLVTTAPDLIIGLKGAHESLREGLKGVAPLFLSGPKDYNDSIVFLETIGKLTGRTAEAAAAKQRFLDKLTEAKEKARRDKKALILFGSDVNFSIVTETGLGGSVLKEISNYPWKVDNPKDDPYGEGSVPYSLEKLLVENPDVIFVESYSYSPGTKPLSEQLAASPIWSKVKAVQNKQVHEVRSPIWGDGRGTRSLGIMLDETLAILYPDLF